MESEIYIIDENDQEYRLKYLDEERIIVQKVMRYKDPEKVMLLMPCKVNLSALEGWPYTDGLKKKILEFHTEFPNAK